MSRLELGYQGLGVPVITLTRGVTSTTFSLLSQYNETISDLQNDLNVQFIADATFTDIRLSHSASVSEVKIHSPILAAFDMEFDSGDFAAFLGYDTSVTYAGLDDYAMNIAPGFGITFANSNTPYTYHHGLTGSKRMGFNGSMGGATMGVSDSLDVELWVKSEEVDQAIVVFDRMSGGAQGRWYGSDINAAAFDWSSNICGWHKVSKDNSTQWDNALSAPFVSTRALKLTFNTWS